MINVRRLNHEEIFINPHLIEMIEATPDTVITLTTGKKLVVEDPVCEIVKKIIYYRRQIGNPNFLEANDQSLSEETWRKKCYVAEIAVIQKEGIIDFIKIKVDILSNQ
jgi:flagellar protein FlbD